MKKKYALTSVLTAAVLLMTSCSGGNNGRNTPAGTDAQTTTAAPVQTSTTALNELDNETDWERYG